MEAPENPGWFMPWYVRIGGPILDNVEIASKKRDKLWTRDFVLICLANLSIFMGFQMIFPTLPLYVELLGGDETMVGLVIGIFTVSAVLIRPFSGMALDVYGRKIVFMLGLLIFLISVLAYNWAPTVLVLLIIRFIHGFGWGAANTAGGTIAADLIPKKRLGEGMGYFGLASTLSMAAAPALGLYIVSVANFTSLFFTSASFVFVTIILGLIIRYRDFEGAGQRGALFEKSALRPSLVMFLLTTTYGSVVTFIVLYAAQRGVDNIGFFFTVYAIVLAATRPAAGILADRKGFDIVVVPGIFMIAVAMLILSRAEFLWVFLIAGSIYGIGFGAVAPSLQALVVKFIPPNRRGAATGTFFSAFDLGIGAGAIVWGCVSKVFGYSQMYLLTAIPAVVALLIYIMFKNTEGAKAV
jgi:MFS family permease